MAYSTHTLGKEAAHGASIRDLFANFTARILRDQRNTRARAELSRLSDHELNDIGLTRSEIDAAVEGKFHR